MTLSTTSAAGPRGASGSRRARNTVALSLCVLAAGFGLLWLLLILAELVWKGVGGLSVGVFTRMTAPPGGDGGLLNAIYGSVVMTVIGVAIGTPLGMLAGTYMAEYGRYARLTTVVRFVNDILLSAPSIIIGLFVYELVVVPMGHFSALAGAVALALIVIPIVARTTEDMLLLVPNPLREAASALGLPRATVITQVGYRAALTGILTGVLLAVARVSGETAPLLFTVGTNQFFNANPLHEMYSLPTVINSYANSAYKDWQDLAWVGALIVTATVLGLSVIARAFGARRATR